MPAYFDRRLQPALQTLLKAAAAAGEARADVEPSELLLDGLRYGASAP